MKLSESSIRKAFQREGSKLHQEQSGAINSLESSIQTTITSEASKARHEQAAAAVLTAFALQSVMAACLERLEAKIENIEYEMQQQNSAEIKELATVKTSISASREQLTAAADSGRECAKNFGLLIRQLHKIQQNALTGWLLPIADMIFDFDKMWDEAKDFLKSGTKAYREGLKYINQRSFTARVGARKSSSGMESEPIPTNSLGSESDSRLDMPKDHLEGGRSHP